MEREKGCERYCGEGVAEGSRKEEIKMRDVKTGQWILQDRRVNLMISDKTMFGEIHQTETTIGFLLITTI